MGALSIYFDSALFVCKGLYVPKETEEELKKVLEGFSLREETGRVFRKTTSSRWKAGTEAGFVKSGHGYRRISINKKAFYEHRVVWALLHGEWPNGFIDHIDGNRSNNKPSNLRVVSYRGNSRGHHKKRSGAKTSRFKGVGLSLDGRPNPWFARVTITDESGKRKWFYKKNLASEEEAAIERDKLATKAGFSEENLNSYHNPELKNESSH